MVILGGMVKRGIQWKRGFVCSEWMLKQGKRNWPSKQFSFNQKESYCRFDEGRDLNVRCFKCLPPIFYTKTSGLNRLNIRNSPIIPKMLDWLIDQFGYLQKEVTVMISENPLCTYCSGIELFNFYQQMLSPRSRRLEYRSGEKSSKI